MADDLFKDLPPPVAERSLRTVEDSDKSGPELSSKHELPAIPLKSALKSSKIQAESMTSLPPPPTVLKSALKRPKTPAESQPEVAAPPEKRLRFKTTTDASEKQVIEAMQKLTSHMKNPSKFCKASKLAIQLIEAGGVKEATSSYFFSLLEAAMMPLTRCNEPSLHRDYHALFSATQDLIEVFSKKQQTLLKTWTIRAVLANDLFTDDSFVFSKATGRIKEAISALPVASEDEDREESASLIHESTSEELMKAEPSPPPLQNDGEAEEADPFGLEALISKPPRGKEPNGNGEMPSRNRVENQEDNKIYLKLQREALLCCLEIAAKRYKIPWCQTAIDILSKHAFDNISRFTSSQRDAIEKLWCSIREQQTRRKQGKSVSGKLDVNAFEWLQQKYSTEKISIRHSVGGGGERKCEQWLG